MRRDNGEFVSLVQPLQGNDEEKHDEFLAQALTFISQWSSRKWLFI